MKGEDVVVVIYEQADHQRIIWVYVGSDGLSALDKAESRTKILRERWNASPDEFEIVECLTE